MTDEITTGTTEKLPRLLFVDDEPSIRTLLSAILRRRGFEVIIASTVPEALTLIASENFDVLLSDLNIGEAGDGFTVVSAMRRTQPKAATFILTGYPAFESALEAIRQQVDDYFVKPAEIDGMVQKIRATLSGPRTQRNRIEPRRLANVLEQKRSSIFALWLEAAKLDDLIQATRLSDEEISDHLPLLIDEILVASRDRKLSPKALNGAQQHGRFRYEQGCGIASLIREMRILHDVISRIVNENLLAIEISALITDIMAVGETIQAFLEESIRAFVHARHATANSTSIQKGGSILLLSKDRELSLLRYHALVNAGFSVSRADSRLEALRLLESRFDALLISYSLSTDSLLEFTQLFGARNPNAPVIGVIKGDWHDLKIELDFTVNGDDGPEALIETVETALNRTQLRLVK